MHRRVPPGIKFPGIRLPRYPWTSISHSSSRQLAQMASIEALRSKSQTPTSPHIHETCYKCHLSSPRGETCQVASRVARFASGPLRSSPTRPQSFGVNNTHGATIAQATQRHSYLFFKLAPWRCRAAVFAFQDVFKTETWELSDRSGSPIAGKKKKKEDKSGPWAQTRTLLFWEFTAPETCNSCAFDICT